MTQGIQSRQWKARLLVVEDEILVARDLQDRLREMGYDVPEVAATGAEALAMVEEFRPDLVLMDIRLRGDLDGVETAERLRGRFAVPVVYLTAYADQVTVERAKVTEPFGYVLKPFQERELESTIAIALYKHQAERRLRKAHEELAAAHQSLARQVRELQGRDRLVQAQMKGFGYGEARGEVLEVIAWVLEAGRLVFYDLDAPAACLRPAAAFGTEQPGRLDSAEAVAALTELPLARGGHLAVTACDEGEPRCSDDGEACAVPVIYGDTALGVVWARGDEGQSLSAEAPYTMWRLCEQAAVLLRMARVTEELELGDPQLSSLLALEAGDGLGA